MRLLDIVVKAFPGDAASLRFSLILQQTMLCATRIEAGAKALYEGGANARTRIVDRLRPNKIRKKGNAIPVNDPQQWGTRVKVPIRILDGQDDDGEFKDGKYWKVEENYYISLDEGTALDRRVGRRTDCSEPCVDKPR